MSSIHKSFVFNGLLFVLSFHNEILMRIHVFSDFRKIYEPDRFKKKGHLILKQESLLMKALF